MRKPAPSARDSARAWDEAAAGWEAQTPHIRAWLAEATAEMLDMADVRPGMRVLDLAAGAGDQSCDAARRVGCDGGVLATDVSPRMVAAAAARLRSAGHGNARCMVADCGALGLDGANFDAAICRLGLMLLPDPLRGLRSVRRALRPGGRFCAMVFSEPGANVCVDIVVSIVARRAGLPAGDRYRPGSLLSLGEPGLIEDLLGSAGFVDITVRRKRVTLGMASLGDYLAFIRTAAAPVMGMLEMMGDAARRAAWAEVEEALSPFSGADRWEAPTELLLAAGAR
ncbi:MAG: ubiquinone biosynthesis protein UbiE [Alphaproteobacteria bacterium]|nr:ubiquinone biosynthesis protein UbiE [Alphaproteobacteria bacterium]